MIRMPSKTGRAGKSPLLSGPLRPFDCSSLVLPDPGVCLAEMLIPPRKEVYTFLNTTARSRSVVEGPGIGPVWLALGEDRDGSVGEIAVAGHEPDPRPLELGFTRLASDLPDRLHDVVHAHRV